MPYPDEMESPKLIITATLANAWIYPEAENYPRTPQEMIDSAFRCWESGASIIHIHLPQGKHSEVIRGIRDRCDVVIQGGMSSHPIEERGELFEAHPDMISIILSHHDECFPDVEVNRLHTRAELEEYAQKCRRYNVKPEFEVWHYGSIWNLNHLVGKKLLDPPYFLTQFFGWPGGTWSPPTPEEFFHRFKYLPPNCMNSVSVMGPAQNAILPLAVATGHNVRIGTEDYPYLKKGVLAKDPGELVARIATISKLMGRESATPSETRRLLGIR
jgi:3-keto-5-aminohexanoate cleavage enzyme